MNQQIIQDFWNLPGVLGVAIIRGQAEPYLYVKEQILDRQKQALTQMILQAIAKAPENVEFFEFSVMGHHAYTYKLNPNLTLLVLTSTNIIVIKLMAANHLTVAVQENIDTAITMFEVLTKKIPQARAFSTAKNAGYYHLGVNNNPPLEVKVTIAELVNALNHLTEFSSNYVGTKLTANYWQLSRPNFDWLDNFQINHSAKIAFSGVITEPVSALQHQRVKEWTAAFIKRCSQIIQDLPTMIEQKGLDEREKRLLL